jgi:hypothetical protein
MQSSFDTDKLGLGLSEHIFSFTLPWRTYVSQSLPIAPFAFQDLGYMLPVHGPLIMAVLQCSLLEHILQIPFHSNSRARVP